MRTVPNALLLFQLLRLPLYFHAITLVPLSLGNAMVVRLAPFARPVALLAGLMLATGAWADAPAAAPGSRGVERFTSPPWPPTRKGCTRKGLGTNPDPAYLSACFYAWFEFTADEERTPLEGRRLLDAYATAPLRKVLDDDERSIRSKGKGVGGSFVFLLFDEFKGLLYDFHVLGATFDPSTGIAEVRTTLRGFDQNLYVRFVRQGNVWRVDDILPHYDRNKNGKTLRDYLSVFEPWNAENR